MPADIELIRFAPELILLVGGCVVLAAGATKSSLRSTWVSGLALLVLGLALAETYRQGNPDGTYAAFGLAITSLGYFTRLITLSIGLVIVLVNWRQPAALERGEYMALILFSLLGVLLTALANDLIVLFFAIELVSVPTYVLVALSREDRRAAEAAVKYFFLGALSAAVLAYGLSFLYGAAGTTTIWSYSAGTATSNFPIGHAIGPITIIGLILVFAGLSFKVAAVPFHVYLPDVYEGAASPVTGMLGFVPKMAGFLALIKIMAAFHWSLPAELNWMIWILAALTMTVGNVLALLQRNVKRILGYSSIAHTGYMLMALLVGPMAGRGPLHDGVAALLFYVAVYGVMNLGAFAMLATMRKGERDVESIDDIAGIARRAPIATLALAVCIFSLMGFPPTAGFLGKLYIFSSAFAIPESHPFHGPLIALAIIAVVNAAIAAAYYLRIVGSAYMNEEIEEPTPAGGDPVRLGLLLCALPMLLLFVRPAILMDHARSASSAIQSAIFQDQSQSRSVAGDSATENDVLADPAPSFIVAGDSLR